jgi:hypothetical protein
MRDLAALTPLWLCAAPSCWGSSSSSGDSWVLGTGPRIGTPRQIFLTTAVMPIPMIPNQLIPKQRRRVIAVCKFVDRTLDAGCTIDYPAPIDDSP